MEEHFLCFPFLSWPVWLLSDLSTAVPLGQSAIELECSTLDSQLLKVRGELTLTEGMGHVHRGQEACMGLP